MRKRCTALLEWLKTADDEAVARTGTTRGHLKQIGYGNRPASAETAARIEAASQSAVGRKQLRPDDWMVIWPELEVA